VSTRILAWAALCVSCSAMTVLWWPFGVVPALVVLVLGTRMLLERRGPRGGSQS
jgi:hypothetical protein